MLRVLLVDDHPMFRAGLRGVIDRMPDAYPVGEAASGDAALQLIGELTPDVVLMDLHMPGVGGVEATRTITQRHPDTAVAVLTMLQDDGSMLAAMRAGARGYLLKGADERRDRRRAAGGRRRRSGVRARRGRPSIGERPRRPTGHQPAIPRPERARNRRARRARPRHVQHRDRRPATPGPLNRTQLRLVDLHQARRGRPCRRHHPSSRGRPRPRRATLNSRRQFESACHSPALNPSHAHSRSRVGSNVVRNRVTWCGSGCLMREQITLLLLVEAVVRSALRWPHVGDPAAG